MNVKRDARTVEFGVATNGTVNCVDDAWFEGTEEQGDNSIEETVGLSGLDGDLSRLRIKIDETIAHYRKSGGDVPNWPDYAYLQRIVATCLQNNLRLRLCNFEYLAREFPKLNRPRNALLLDVMYVRGPGHAEANEKHGINLFAQVLNGEPFLCEAFFVTGNEDIVRRVLEEKKE